MNVKTPWAIVPVEFIKKRFSSPRRTLESRIFPLPQQHALP